MALNKSAFESACARFRESYPDFEDFQKPGEQYLKQERDYKVELKNVFSDKLVPLLDADPAEFVRMFLRIMRQRLDSIGQPQNLVSWRALAALERLGDHSSSIGKRLQEVLRVADGNPNELRFRIDAFGNAAKDLIKRRSSIRELVTFPLMFHRTDKHIALRLTYWNRCGRVLSGGGLIKVGSLVTGAEVFRCLDLAQEIEQKLNDAGWRVRDMIDVQSFVFEITRTRSSEEPVPPPPMSSLEAIAEYVETSGMRIQDRTLRRYHYSVRSRGFVILAGPSGTGKTWLTKLYAEAVRAQYYVASVAPNWAANEDLLGYFNPIDNLFHPTPFLKFIDDVAKN